ncbi:hypothetical protein H0H81_005596 [Sphagnurus paluster]|uniref:Uncharacterized protein n=1 Tax=Sphagnurus paluster TaxID=117069 RepID=A0A9P7FYH9_9AGAR|nr:hypothetical protein H0H81_005596 [Sphagnurus paluster]
MDAARFKAALAMFPMFFVAGGWIPLAATEQFYIVAKFVTKPKKGRKKGTPTTSTSTTTVNTSAPVTPIPGTTPPSDKTPQDTSEALKAAAASLAGGPEPDGAILHTVVVSQCCFKIGRITVPPGIVFAVNGFSASPPSSVSPSQPSAQTAPEISPAPRYSRTNPPPHWPRAKAVMSHPRGGSPRALAALFAGGWRNVPQAERWWDTAMGGSVEERRVKALEQINALGVGMAGARGV